MSTNANNNEARPLVVIVVRTTVQRDEDKFGVAQPPKGQPCLVCGEPAMEGTVVLGRRLCSECEKAITNLDACDSDYDFFVAKIKEAWRPVFRALRARVQRN